jgi:dienelactone hydrolase
VPAGDGVVTAVGVVGETRVVAAFVIVHGAWGGGWEWAPVARRMRAWGHEVFSPSLTGMGERAHLGRGQATDLATHVQDVVATLEYEDLHGAVLCGASCGGPAWRSKLADVRG